MPRLADRLSRRDLLAGAAAAALVLAGCGTARRPKPVVRRPRAPAPMRKGVSMEFHLDDAMADNDPRSNGNLAEIVATKTTWVKLFVSWSDLQAATPRPATAAESWDQLNSSGRRLANLDQAIRALNDASARLAPAGSIAVVVTLLADTPPWASARGRKSTLPDELDMQSPWGWLVSHLCARYATATPLPAGVPGPSLAPGAVRTGNTAGAQIAALEIVNEPNLGYGHHADLAYGVAAMMRTAESCAAYWGAPAMLLGPATADTTHRVSPLYDEFTRAVLTELGGFAPRIYVGWSHHNYSDCFDATPPRAAVAPDATRVAAVQRLLAGGDANPSWKDGTDRTVWLTEGGVVTTPGSDSLGTATPADGAAGVAACFAQMQALGDVPLFTNHQIVDPTDAGPGSFCSGMRTSSGATPPLAPKPLRDVWAGLPTTTKALG